MPNDRHDELLTRLRSAERQLEEIAVLARALEDKAARYDDLIAAVRKLNEVNTALLALVEDAPDAEEGRAWNEYEIALHEVLEFAWGDDHADAMERAGVTCYELHTANVTRSA